MAQPESIEATEKGLWKASDTLRSDSELTSNEYFLSVMGLNFLRHPYNRYLAVEVGDRLLPKFMNGELLA